ncbi:hypothetical protein [Streptomyces sp. NBC_01361]|uniref:hypothetical protein n=1 Tax=Streptomyces sp. NBC_01361 TaxID=2903838 RepID=UPI002E366015|nr:hypothetical protein [Streptomyces sp. NBC_01361]
MVQDWFRVTAVDSALTLIDEPHTHELLDANIWLVRGRDRERYVHTMQRLRELPVRIVRPET